MFKDSLDKVVFSYFAAVSKQDFEYKNKVVRAKPLKVSSTLDRSFLCVEGCAGCCPVFSLDYLPSDLLPTNNDITRRKVFFDQHTKILFSDPQLDNVAHHCKYVDKIGRCSIHGNHPFTCDFELIRTSIFVDQQRPNIIGQRIYGRAWNMLRCDGFRGALCKIDDSVDGKPEVFRKLLRLKRWSDYFGIDTWIPEICDIIERQRFNVVLNVKGIKRFFI